MFKRTINTLIKKIRKQTLKNNLRVYPQAEHGIERRLVSRNAVKVCDTLQQAGYQAYLVGGAVRDLLLGLEPKDFDVSTNATPEQVKKLFRRSRIIGRRFRLVHVYFGREIIETSTFRAPNAENESLDAHGRILNDNAFGTLEQDAARRDFTLNALYYDPNKEEILDFHHGVQDLRNKVVKIIGDANTRYREDPVRMLRAVRFSAKLNATIETNTLEPIAKLAPLISHIPDSRLFDETLKLLSCGNALNCLKALKNLGLSKEVLPLLDLVLEQNGANKFIQIALERTDQRIRTHKPVSPSFIYATILWPLVSAYWKKNINSRMHYVPALIEAADQVLEEQVKKLALQRRHSSEMREIWFMQPRFERQKPKAIYKLLEQGRFRAAVDFLQVRAACNEFDSLLAQWWLELADASKDSRHQMIDELKQDGLETLSSPHKKRSKSKRRRPRRRPTKDQLNKKNNHSSKESTHA